MAKAQKVKADDQLKAFRKAARELRADESKEQFQDVLQKIAKTKPKTDNEIKEAAARKRGD